jgi:hypothetical protein
VLHCLEATAKPLKLLKSGFIFFQCTLKSLNNQADFDSAIGGSSPPAPASIK